MPLDNGQNKSNRFRGSRPETEEKYRQAIELYCTTGLSCAAISRTCKVTVSGFQSPMIIPDNNMEKFIYAVESVEKPQYYLPAELTPAMYRRRIHIVEGNLDGYEGMLLTTRGSGSNVFLLRYQHGLPPQ